MRRRRRRTEEEVNRGAEELGNGEGGVWWSFWYSAGVWLNGRLHSVLLCVCAPLLACFFFFSEVHSNPGVSGTLPTEWASMTALTVL